MSIKEGQRRKCRFLCQSSQVIKDTHPSKHYLLERNFKGSLNSYKAKYGSPLSQNIFPICSQILYPDSWNRLDSLIRGHSPPLHIGSPKPMGDSKKSLKK